MDLGQRVKKDEHSGQGQQVRKSMITPTEAINKPRQEPLMVSPQAVFWEGSLKVLGQDFWA